MKQMKNKRKAILLAGGLGTRLYPLTKETSKHLLPVYDKPMIYYPLHTLLAAGVTDILLISTPRDLSSFQQLLGDGSRFGITLSYMAQPEPEGIVQAFLLGEKFIAGEPCALALGDNIFLGEGLVPLLEEAVENSHSGTATIFGCASKEPERFGVIEWNTAGQVVSLEEKPEHPKSEYAVTGLYFYDSRVVEFAKKVKPSKRGELEITDLNRMYLEAGALEVKLLTQEVIWMDVGTPESLREASEIVQRALKDTELKKQS